MLGCPVQNSMDQGDPGESANVNKLFKQTLTHVTFDPGEIN